MRTLSILALSFFGSPALAQISAAPQAEDVAVQDEGAEAESTLSVNGEIVVVATRLRGQIDAAQPPIATLDEGDIASYGAASIAELLTAIAPQTGSGRGRGDGPPVVLVNGQRISSFREMRNFPPEAIRRMEVLPEETALRFGYPPDQRVVNMILKDKYSSRAVELQYGQPDRGGTSTVKGEATLLKLAGNNRFNANVAVDHASPLTEAERGVVQDPASLPGVAGDPDPAAYRSLVPESSNYSANLTWTRGIGKGGLGGSVSANLAVSRNDSTAMSGLNSAILTDPLGASALRTIPGALLVRSKADTLQGGAGVNTYLGAWRFNTTLDYTHSQGTTWTDRRADTSALLAAAAAGTLDPAGPLPGLAQAGADKATTNSDRIDVLATLAGNPLRLPAGPVAATVKAGYTWLSYDSTDQRTINGSSSLLRKRTIGGLNLAIPLTSRKEGFLSGVGDVALNLSADWSHVSDFGAINDWSAGLTWGVTSALGLQASYISNQTAPSVSQLGAPLAISYNVPVYDFTTGQSVLATVTTGGNPLLGAQRQRDLKLGLNWKLPGLSNSNLLVEYFDNHSNNVASAFPLLTPAVEAAFPGRVTRDGSGRIVAVDRRPVALADQRETRLRWGFNLSGALGKRQAAAGGPPGGARGGGPGGMPGFGRGGQGRWNVSLYHTVQFMDHVQLQTGGPVLDLLGGDALASTGGVARHSLQMEGGAFYKGLGLRLSGSWTAPTRVKGSGLPGSSDLRFGSVADFDLRLFADLGQQKSLTTFSPFFNGARMTLRVKNVLNSRQKVTDAAGLVPLSYQPDLIDPLGRVFEIELRKMF